MDEAGRERRARVLGQIVQQLVAGHDHARHPQVDDVPGGSQELGRVEALKVLGLVRPAEGREGPQPGRRPGVHDIGVLTNEGLAGVRVDGADLEVFDRCAGHAVLVVPDRNAVAPPELTADAPVLDVVEPVEVDLGPALGAEVEALAIDGGDGGLGQLLHLHEPLLADQGLDDGLRAVRDRLAVGDVVHALELAHLLELGDDLLAGELAALALEGTRVLVHGAVLVEQQDNRQVVPGTALVVGQVVAGRDLHAASAELHVHGLVGDHGDFAVHEGHPHGLAHQGLEALVVGVNGNTRVAQQGLGPGGSHGDEVLRAADRVADVPHLALAGLHLDFVVRHRGLQSTVPVHNARALVDELAIPQAHEGRAHRGDHVRVQGEGRARPIGRAAEGLKLVQDRRAVLFLPLPDLVEESLAAHVLAGLAGLLEDLLLDDGLGRDARVVRAGNPERVEAAHALEAHDDVLDRAVKGVAHVQDTGDVGGRNRDREGLALRLALDKGWRCEITARLPLGVDVILVQGRVVTTR